MSLPAYERMRHDGLHEQQHRDIVAVDPPLPRRCEHEYVTTLRAGGIRPIPPSLVS